MSSKLQLIDIIGTTRQVWPCLQDDERRRIARDLHDGVGQTLAGALMALAQARSAAATLPACEPALRQAEDLLQHGIREVRTV